jgi:hypothetical protein
MKIFKIFIGVVAILCGIYFLGPHPSKPIYNAQLPTVPSNAIELETYVKKQEALHIIKPHNEAEIIWADSTKQKTNYAIVYLHGFSASKEEGAPVHKNIAKQFGCNLYLSRLSQHGIDTVDALINLTPDNLWETAKEALAIGKQLGNKVILMSTSTGGTLALQLAATYPELAGLVLYSPNIAINDANAPLLNNPWGLQIARMVKGSNYNIIKTNNPQYALYWNTKYRLEAISQLEELVETKMIEPTFKSVTQPVLALYYYKDEKNQDPVVKVSATKKMFAQLGTPVNKKRQVAMPNTGNHVLASPILSKDVAGVEMETAKFLQEIMQLKPIK